MAKNIAKLAIMSAFAIALGFLERLIPLDFVVPGIKLGLGNIVILLTMLLMDLKSGFIVMLAKVFLSGLLFGGFASILYSLSGGLLSFFLMALMTKTTVISPVGISVTGGCAHNIGQIIIAVLMLETPGLFSYLPVLLVSGVVTGVITGIIVQLLYKKLQYSTQ